MQVKQTKNEGLKREYKVTIPASQINAQLEEKLKKAAANMKMPGFRPGKVPLELVKQKHGPALLGEVVEQEVSKASVETLKKEDIKPAMQPKINITSFDDGKDLEFDISLEIYPDIPEVDFKKFTLKKWAVEVGDKDVQEGLERLAKANRDFKAPAKKRAAKEGDLVVIDFEGSVDGQVFTGGTAEKYRLELGSGQFIPGFEEQLIGEKEGGEKVVKVKFPEEYHSKDLAGKDADFKVKLHEVQEPSDAAIDDELAKKAGLESLDKLKEEVKKQIEQDFDHLVRMKLKRDLFDVLDEACKFEVPETMVEQEFESLWSPREKELKDAGKKDKEIEKEKKEIERLANRRVRLGMYLSDLGGRQNLSATDQELREAMIAQARAYPGQEQRVIEYFQQNRDALEQLKGPILEEKVVEFLLSSIKTEDEKTTTKKLMEYYESEQE